MTIVSGPMDRARAKCVVVDGRLQVHEHLARLVVGVDEALLVVDPGDAPPAAAVEGLHVQRVAEVLGDLLEVEGPVVLRRTCRPSGRCRRGSCRGRARSRGTLSPRRMRATVGAVLLHRLEGERAVEQVGVVDERGLLEPLARVVVPVGEAVDDELGAHRLAQVERLDGQTLARQLVRHALVGRDRSRPARAAPRRRSASPPRLRAASR